MTGKEFLRLSAIEVKDWIEEQTSSFKISQTLDLYKKQDKRKIIKWPVRRIDRYGNNDVEHWQITVTNGEQITYASVDLINLKIFTVKHVEIRKNSVLVDFYDG